MVIHVHAVITHLSQIHTKVDLKSGVVNSSSYQDKVYLLTRLGTFHISDLTAALW